MNSKIATLVALVVAGLLGCTSPYMGEEQQAFRQSDGRWAYWNTTRGGCRFADVWSVKDTNWEWSGSCKNSYVDGCGVLIMLPGSTQQTTHKGCFVNGRKEGQFIRESNSGINFRLTEMYQNGNVTSSSIETAELSPVERARQEKEVQDDLQRSRKNSILNFNPPGASVASSSPLGGQAWDARREGGEVCVAPVKGCTTNSQKLGSMWVHNSCGVGVMIAGITDGKYSVSDAFYTAPGAERALAINRQYVVCPKNTYPTPDGARCCK